MFAALDPMVDLYYYMQDIFTMKNPMISALFLMINTFTILYYEIMLPLIPLGIAVFILSNSYYMRRFSVGKAQLGRTVKFIIEQMDMVIEGRPKIDQFMSDVIFWGKP